jgi:hypothetical protein
MQEWRAALLVSGFTLYLAVFAKRLQKSAKKIFHFALRQKLFIHKMNNYSQKITQKQKTDVRNIVYIE